MSEWRQTRPLKEDSAFRLFDALVATLTRCAEAPI